MKPQIKFTGDVVLPDQGCRTPQGAMIDEYGAAVEWWLAGRISKKFRKNCPFHFIHYEPHLKSPESDLEAVPWEASACVSGGASF
jgi:hypothetical protein